MTTPCVSIILPVYNEDGTIAACLRGLSRAMAGLDHEILVCYDFDEDRTLPAIAAMEDRPAAVRTVRNTLGRGVAFAIRAGFQAARGDVIVTTMADLSDPPEVIPLMARKVREEGADVVSGSRYMEGGSQAGGPPFKVLLSRAAGLSLRWLAGVGTHDATTNFRAYSRRFIDQVKMESRHGFELALELTVKAHLRDFKVDEVPSTWKDRSAGESRFRLWAWLPRYLRWYLQAATEPIVVWGIVAATTVVALLLAVRHAPVVPFWPDEWMYLSVASGREPMTLGWLFSFHNEHRIPLPKLIWWAVERLSGFDGRWGSALNVLMLSSAAGVLILGLRSMRGRTVWTDAIAPLLLLHGGHWENVTWPFQVAFCLFAFAIAWILSRILRLSRAPRDTADPWLAGGVFLLPFVGASTFPFVVLLAPWVFWISRRDPRPLRRRLSCALAAGALLLLPLYFGFQNSPGFRSSSGIDADLRVALQLLASSLGIGGLKGWPWSAWIAGALLLLSAGILLRHARARHATGILLALGALVGLALMVGHARSGAYHLAGFLDRYMSLFALAPFLVYAAIPFAGHPGTVRIGHALLLALAALLYPANQEHAVSRLSDRRFVTDLLLRDVRAGVPTSLVARRNRTWWPRQTLRLEQGLDILAQDRLAVYRTCPPPAPFPPGANLTLEDGRKAVDLSSRVEVALPPTCREVEIQAGLLNGAPEDLSCTARLLRDGAPAELLGVKRIGRAGAAYVREIYRVPAGSWTRLELTVQPASLQSAARPWAIVEYR